MPVTVALWRARVWLGVSWICDTDHVSFWGQAAVWALPSVTLCHLGAGSWEQATVLVPTRGSPGPPCSAPTLTAGAGLWGAHTPLELAEEIGCSLWVSFLEPEEGGVDSPVPTPSLSHP